MPSATAQLQTLIDPDLGHAESPDMRAAVLKFLCIALRQPVKPAPIGAGGWQT